MTLFSPLRIGSVTVRNRIVFSAHLTNYAENGLPSAQHAAYYAERAAGGAGLVITEENSTYPNDQPYEKLIHGYLPSVVPGYRRITDAVHAHDVPILAQLNHNGGQSSGMYTQLPVWAPSAVADPLFREVAVAVDHTQIAEVVDGYRVVAGHCVEGGFDGVELQCSHSSIVRGFLSPATNLRLDEYGGSLTNRARILLEIVDAVRGVLGDRVLGVRICGDELIRGGTTLDEGVALARLLDATGQVDYLNTSIGVATSTLYMIEAGMHVPTGYANHIPAAIRAAVSIPVIGVGRFREPAQAEQALRDGVCDLVGVVRGQIADPSFAAHAQAGARVRTCLYCNQECVGRMGLNRWLGCVVNPRAGRESVPVAAPGRRRRVHVVGAGPAGLQAALTAATRGHAVTLSEAAGHLGGQVTLAAAGAGRAEFGALAADLERAVRAAGVDVRAGTRISAVDLGYADVVVLATGARPVVPVWAVGQARVVDVRAVLDGSAAPEGTVVVVDEVGFHPATSVAESLAQRGCAVEIVTPGMVVGQDLGLTLDLELWNRRVAALGVRQRTDVVVTGFAEGVLSLLHHPTGTPLAIDCDWVVCAVAQAPVDELWRALRDGPLEVHRIGDCLAPRRADAAVREGERVGMSL